MKRKEIGKKGFTLIELLAVIVILAVLMAIAIPKVTQYITKSRKDSLVTTSKDFINAVRNDATSEMFDFPIGVDDVTIISLDLIKLEKGGKKSSFNGTWLPKYSYVAVINVGTDEDPDYEYYISVRDSKRYNIALTEENELTRESIIRNNPNNTKVTIDSMCGSEDGEYKVLNNITGLESHRPSTGWNATVYSSVSCNE